jgi:hypothetical protein
MNPAGPPGSPPPYGYGQQQYPQQAYGQAPYLASGLLPSTTRMNKWTYRGFMMGFPLIGAALAVWAATDSKVTELMYVAPFFFVVGAPFIYVWLYKMWAAIQDGHARTTPGKAVALMFVPIFNWYWIFQVLPGYATDYNAYLDRHRIPAPKLSQNFILAALILPIAFPLGGLLFGWLLIGRMCDAVNALPTTRA